MTLSEIAGALVGLAFIVLFAAAFLKFVSQVLYRLSGGYEREILDELRDHREQQE
ncbi:MAG: hypothetical protein OXL36_01885 [Bryobacterales bacterium]|nr:hypothetical protein [Bryobacterales bacterium]MDE0296359.1 hypothetical protein [Bryobacterales bacterium]